jgi:hypothetical protein
MNACYPLFMACAVPAKTLTGVEGPRTSGTSIREAHPCMRMEFS